MNQDRMVFFSLFDQQDEMMMMFEAASEEFIQKPQRGT